MSRQFVLHCLYCWSESNRLSRFHSNGLNGSLRSCIWLGEILDYLHDASSPVLSRWVNRDLNDTPLTTGLGRSKAFTSRIRLFRNDFLRCISCVSVEQDFKVCRWHRVDPSCVHYEKFAPLLPPHRNKGLQGYRGIDYWLGQTNACHAYHPLYGILHLCTLWNACFQWFDNWKFGTGVQSWDSHPVLSDQFQRLCDKYGNPFCEHGRQQLVGHVHHFHRRNWVAMASLLLHFLLFHCRFGAN